MHPRTQTHTQIHMHTHTTHAHPGTHTHAHAHTHTHTYHVRSHELVQCQGEKGSDDGAAGTRPVLRSSSLCGGFGRIYGE